MFMSFFIVEGTPLPLSPSPVRGEGAAAHPLLAEPLKVYIFPIIFPDCISHVRPLPYPSAGYIPATTPFYSLEIAGSTETVKRRCLLMCLTHVHCKSFAINSVQNSASYGNNCHFYEFFFEQVTSTSSAPNWVYYKMEPVF